MRYLNLKKIDILREKRISLSSEMCLQTLCRIGWMTMTIMMLLLMEQMLHFISKILQMVDLVCLRFVLNAF